MEARLNSYESLSTAPIQTTSTRWSGETIALFSLLFVATCADYTWLGPATIPTYLTMGALLWLYQWRAGRIALASTTQQLLPLVIAPWMALLAVIAVSDFTHDTLALSFSPIVAYGAISLAAFLTAATLGNVVAPAKVWLMLATVGIVQGGIGVAQYLDLPGAWEASTMFADWARISAENAHLAWSDAAARIGRARGTQLYVHKFTSNLTPLACALVALAIEPPATLGISKRLSTLLRTAAVLAGLGVVVTFSRSGTLGLAVTFVILVWEGSRSRYSRALGLLLGAGLTAWIASELGVFGSVGFSRVLGMSSEQVSISSRTEVWGLAFEAFKNSPLLGAGTYLDTSAAGIGIHSVVLRMLASYGVFAGALYLLAFYRTSRLFARKKRAPETWARPVALAALCALAGAFVDASVHTSGFLFRDIAQAVLIGVLAGQLLRATDPRRLRKRRR